MRADKKNRTPARDQEFEMLIKRFDDYAIDLAKDMLVMMTGSPDFGPSRIKYFEGRISFLQELRDSKNRSKEQKESA